jgi:hypothetical protein
MALVRIPISGIQMLRMSGYKSLDRGFGVLSLNANPNNAGELCIWKGPHEAMAWMS